VHAEVERDRWTQSGGFTYAPRVGAVTEPTEVEAAARARVGLRLEGDWTLCEVIGCGGTAAVYRATRSDGSVGAAKVMHSHLAGDRGWLRRLAREAELLRTLEHPGLVRLLYIGTTEGVTPFLVTELLQGHSLDVLRKQAVSRRMPLPDVLKYAREILGALTHAHALGVVHRDLKPSNVFITTDGHVKVLDFGIAAGGDLVAPDDGSRSATRGLLGTPAYMAPEQARARWDFVDHRTDLWAVGAIMFTLLTGEFVHVAVTENERLGLAMSRRARSIASVMRGLDTELVRVVDRALEYDSSERHPCAPRRKRHGRRSRSQLG
jgi:serine/threonine protein kinase